MSFKLKRNIVVTTLILVLVVITSINYFASTFFKEKISTLLLQEQSKYYTANVENIQVQLLSRSITFHNVSLQPNPESYRILKNENDSLTKLELIHIPSIEFSGINLSKLSLENSIDIQNIIIKNLSLQKFVNSKLKIEKKPIQFDSIHLTKLKGLEIHKIVFKQPVYQEIDVHTNQLKVALKTDKLLLGGFKLTKNTDSLFSLNLLHNKYKFENFTLDDYHNKYQLKLENVLIDKELNYAELKNFSYHPTIPKLELANQYRFNKEVYDIDIENLSVYNYQLDSLFQGKGHFMDSIVVDNVGLKIYKDKRKPFNLEKRPKLIHQKLKKINTPFLLPKLIVKNGSLVYDEFLKQDNQRLKIELQPIHLILTNVSSIASFREHPMKANMHAKINKHASFWLNLSFNMASGNNRFFYSGSMENTPFKLFDTAIFPSLGMKIIQGELQKLEFSGQGNPKISEGKMTLLYNNLEAEVFKNHSNEESEILSWTVNHILHQSNPNHNGKIRTVEMYTERVEYKGFGNFLWKTLQSGIVNTFSPIGKISKEKTQRKHKKKHKKN